MAFRIFSGLQQSKSIINKHLLFTTGGLNSNVDFKMQLMHSYAILLSELEIHQSKGFFDKDVLLLTLEDPKARVGSGGASVNALLVVAEHLSAKAGYEVKCSVELILCQCCS